MPVWLVRFVQSKYIYIICIITLFVLAECYFASLHTFPAIRKETDGIGYMIRATEALFRLDPYHGPGYSWAIRLVHGITRISLFTSAKLVSMLAGAMLLISVYTTLSFTDNRRTAGMATLLTSVSPVLLQYSTMAMSDMLASAFMWGVILLLVKSETPQFKQFLLAGILAGLAYLTRYMFVFMIFVPGVFILINGWSRKLLLNMAGFYIGFFFIISPWLIFVFHEKGDPFWNLNYLNIAFKMYREGEGWNAFPSVEQYPSIIAVIKSSPSAFFKTWFKTIALLPIAVFRQIPVFGIFVGGIGFLVWIFQISARKSILLVTFIGYGLLVSLVWLEPRFLIVFLPLAALGIVRAIELIPCQIQLSFANNPQRIPLRLPVFILTISIVAIISERQVSGWMREQQANEYATCAGWIKTNCASGSIMEAKPHIAFFAGMKNIRFRQWNLQTKDLSQLEEVLATIRPNYFVYDERYSLDEFPQFEILLDTNNVPSFLSVLHVVEFPKRLILFEYTGNKLQAGNQKQ